MSLQKIPNQRSNLLDGGYHASSVFTEDFPNQSRHFFFSLTLDVDPQLLQHWLRQPLAVGQVWLSTWKLICTVCPTCSTGEGSSGTKLKLQGNCAMLTSQPLRAE